MIWASRWSVALRTFYRQILSVLYSSFPFGNFRPRLVRALLVHHKLYILYKYDMNFIIYYILYIKSVAYCEHIDSFLGTLISTKHVSSWYDCRFSTTQGFVRFCPWERLINSDKLRKLSWHDPMKWVFILVDLSGHCNVPSFEHNSLKVHRSHRIHVKT